MPQKSNTVILPWFTVENHETLRPWLSTAEMYKLLQRGGFKVKQVFDLAGQILNPEMTATPINHIRFEVELPSGWSLEQGYDGYGLKDNSIAHLLDAQGHLRGHIDLDWEDDYHPREAKLHCRYSLDPLNVHMAKVERPKNSIVQVVVDRSEMKPEQPAEFPVIVYCDIRPIKLGGIQSIKLDDFQKFTDKELARVLAKQPQLDPPIYRWLHENYPQWRDPFAYW